MSYSFRVGKYLLLSLLPISLIVFQNCGGNFNVEQLSSTAAIESLSSDPKISFSPTPDVFNTDSVNFEFDVKVSDSDSISSIKCQLLNNQPEDCSSRTVNYSNLNDGNYSLKISVLTSSGRKVEAVKIFQKDSAPPVVQISGGPSAITSAVQSEFVFAASDNLSGVLKLECAKDNGEFLNCQSPVIFSSVSLGTHVFKVRATDMAGNVSVTSQFDWNVVSGNLAVVLTEKPNTTVSNMTTAKFSFVGTGTVSYECSLNGAAYSQCVSPVVIQGLANKDHAFEVKGIGPTGTRSEPAIYRWKVDTIPPSEPNVMANLDDTIVVSKSVSFAFDSIDLGSGVESYQCSLDNGGFIPCKSPLNFSELSMGEHSFRVRSYDNGKNVSPLSKEIVWSVVPSFPVLSPSQISVGFNQVCTAKFSGTNPLLCWGEVGQLGGITKTATQIPGLDGHTIFSVGSFGSIGTLCSVKNGAVSCFSTNSNYSSANQGGLFQPAGLSSGVTDISTGTKICVVQNSAVKCWDDGDKNPPEIVPGLETNISRVGSDLWHNCAIKRGTVWCWGGLAGPLKNDGNMDLYYYPKLTRIGSLVGVVSIAVNRHGGCATLENGKVNCWGYNRYGLLGSGVADNELRLTPVELSSLSNVVTVASKGGTACAVTYSRSVLCWGIILKGQSTTDVVESKLNTFTSTPTVVPGLEKDAGFEISVGESNVCVQAGGIKCWGDNYWGQLGNKSLADSATPVSVQF